MEKPKAQNEAPRPPLPEERNPARKPFIHALTGMVFWVRDKTSSQISKQRIFDFGFCALLSAVCALTIALPCGVYAQEDAELVSLTKKIIESKDKLEVYSSVKEVAGIYFTGHKYDDCVKFLRSLSGKKKELEPVANYYIALSRYNQLKYLEETQDWDRYFSDGNTYRDEMVASAKDAIDTTSSDDPVNIYARLTLWKFHNDQQDTFRENQLEDLMKGVIDFSAKSRETAVVKDVADQLLASGEKARSKELYKIYVDKLITSQIKDEDLKEKAAGFYQEGNPDLAEIIYDAYIGRITKALPPEKSVPFLIEIARNFSYKDKGAQDPAYAEKVFKKIEEVGGKSAFDEELMYLRFYNLEKTKEYAPAKDGYINLLQRFPATKHADELNFKIGIISTYALRDINAGKGYFEKLAQKETVTPQVVSSLYQLGLISQWQGDLNAAKDYYNKAIEKAATGFEETVKLAQERLKEISENRPLEYNLKTFLDASLKEENADLNGAKADLKASPYRGKPAEDFSLTAAAYATESGCMQVELQYLWSGHKGTAQTPGEQSAFTTQYIHPGTKEVNLVVVSSSGIIDRNIAMLDVD